MTLRQIAAALRRFWPACAGVFALILAAGVAAAFVPSERFEATAVLSAEPASEQTLDFGGAQALQFLIPPVVSRLESEGFEAQVRRQVQGLDGGSLEITAENEPGTGIVSLAVSAPSRAGARDGATEAVRRITAEPGATLIRVSLLNPVEDPESITARRRAPILLGTGILGLIGALFTAAGLGATRRRLPDSDTRDRFARDVLGEIPRVRDLPVAAPHLFHQAGPPEALEAFRSLEANLVTRLLAHGRGSLGSSIAVTSWLEGEGKTTVTANLAWALASFGRALTVVDGDLRHPRLHEHLLVDAGPGVGEMARGAVAAEVRQQTLLSNLHVLAAGNVDRHPAEVIHAALPRLLGDLSGELVLIDTPPMYTAEATLLAAQVDAVILVVDGQKRRPAELEEALEQLRFMGTQVLGVVLNRVTTQRSKRAASYYHSRRPPAESQELAGDSRPD